MTDNTEANNTQQDHSQADARVEDNAFTRAAASTPAEEATDADLAAEWSDFGDSSNWNDGRASKTSADDTVHATQRKSKDDCKASWPGDGAEPKQPALACIGGWEELRSEPLTISAGRDAYSSVVPETNTWEQFFAALKKHTVYSWHQKKDRTRVFAPSILIDYARPPQRADGSQPKNLNDAHVAGMTVLVYDLDNKDGGAPQMPDTATQLLRSLGVAHAYYSSWSSTIELPKWRLVIAIPTFLLRSAEDRAVYDYAYRLVGDLLGLRYDATCRNPGRFYYKPGFRLLKRPSYPKSLEEGKQQRIESAKAAGIFSAFHPGGALNFLEVAEWVRCEMRAGRIPGLKAGRAQHAGSSTAGDRSGASGTFHVADDALKTKDIRSFVYACGDQFDIERAYRELAADDVHGGGDGVWLHCRCGNDRGEVTGRAHSAGFDTGNRTGFGVRSARDGVGFACKCFTEGCGEHFTLPGAESQDRLLHVDALCLNVWNVADAAELIKFCHDPIEAQRAFDARVEQEERKSKPIDQDALKKDIDDKVAVFTDETGDADIKGVLESLARLDDALYVEGVIRLIVGKTKRTKKVLEAALRAAKDKHRAERKAQPRAEQEPSASPGVPGDDALKDWPMPHQDLAYGGTFGMQTHCGAPFITLYRGEEEDLKITQLFTPLAIIGRVHYYDDNVEGQRWQAFTAQGVKLIDLPASSAIRGNGIDFVADLRDHGVRFDLEGVKFVKRWAMGYAPATAPIRIVAKPGWYDIGYIAPNGELFPTAAEHPDVELAEGNPLKGAARGGTLEGAQAVADAVLASGHEAMQMGLLAGPVGAILDLAEMDSFTLYFGGATSKGKSTSQKLKTSSWGTPKLNEGLFRLVHGTPNARENQIVHGNGCGSDFDETRSMSGEEVEDFIFRVQGGKTRERAHRTGETNRKTRVWRTCVSMSGEIGVIQKIEAEGKTMAGGTVARVLFVDADNAPMLTSDMMGMIEACQAHYGWAGPAVVEQLIAQGYAQEPHRVIEDVVDYARRLAGGGAPEVQLRAAKMYGAVWLSAKLLQDAGYIPASCDVEGLLRRQWEGRFSAERDEGKSVVERALIKLRHTILSAEISNGTGAITDRRSGTLLAERHDDEGVYCVLLDAVQSIIGTIDKKSVSKALGAQGMLVKPGDQTRNMHKVMPGGAKIDHLRIKVKFFREVPAADDKGRPFRDATSSNRKSR
jgi:hypothetical protein